MAPHEHPSGGDVAAARQRVRRGGQVLRGDAAHTPTFDQLLLDGRRPGDDARPAADVASTTSEAWRVLRIQAEFVEGFGTLAGLGPAVSVFGSARTPEGSAEYALAHEVGTRLARAGYTVITGGGPGTMAAANRGAHEAGGES
ncbi:TIGR00730 family Rossman fold protein, partial [Micrococcus luteus]|nr:TIGR00730 family Rossman fold protein [Micrococcus luteus]